MRTRHEAQALEPVAVRIPRAAAMLGIGRSTLYQCIGAGEIETIKVGRATLVPVESLHAFIAARRQTPPAAGHTLPSCGGAACPRCADRRHHHPPD